MQETPEKKLKKHLDKSAVKTHSVVSVFQNILKCDVITSHDSIKYTSQLARGQDLLKTFLSFTCDLYVKLSLRDDSIHMRLQT